MKDKLEKLKQKLRSDITNGFCPSYSEAILEKILEIQPDNFPYQVGDKVLVELTIYNTDPGTTMDLCVSTNDNNDELWISSTNIRKMPQDQNEA
jgi:hypothetical protein